MSVICILQVDKRYDEFLFEKINGKEVIKYTIDQVSKINNINKIIITTYNCEENKEFLELCKYNPYIEVEYSKEENLSERFIKICKKYDGKIVMRILGTQCFLDYEKVNKCIENMYQSNVEFYYPINNNGTLAECISRKVVLQNINLIISRDRYYKVFIEDKVECNMIKEKIKHIPNNLYVNNSLSLYIAKKIIQNGIENIKKTLEEINDKLLEKMYSNQSYFNKVGYIESILQERIADNEGELPWLSYCAIDILKQRVNKNMVVFEYGSGNSTIWWSKRVKKIVSVEHNEEWYTKLKDSNINLPNLIFEKLEDNNRYENAILINNELYDVIVIDGRRRVKCARSCIKALKDDGVIIWDDSDRGYYKEGMELLRKNKFKELAVKGIGAMGSGTRQTSIFYREKNCLNI